MNNQLVRCSLQMNGQFKVDGSGNVELKEEDGIDYAAVTVQMPGGERVPFLFTVKELNAKGTLDGFGGDFVVPSYRGSTFLDPKVQSLDSLDADVVLSCESGLLTFGSHMVHLDSTLIQSVHFGAHRVSFPYQGVQNVFVCIFLQFSSAFHFLPYLHPDVCSPASPPCAAL